MLQLVRWSLQKKFSADLDVALACVGRRAYFEGEVEPEALEPAIPLPANFPHKFRKAVDLARGSTMELPLNGVQKKLCWPSLCDLRDPDRNKYAFTLDGLTGMTNYMLGCTTSF